MARKRKEYDDDDGRTIADMSDIHQADAMGGHPRGPKQFEAPPSRAPRAELTVRERLGMVWMALRASLLVAAVFLAALALIIVLISLLGR